MVILNDFDTSIRKALEEIDLHYEEYSALVICGTHTPHNTEDMINLIQIARETKLPFYGECFGHQLACIEWARNVMGIKDATSEEFGEGIHVVKKLPELKVGLYGGESYWNNYEVIPEVLDNFKKNHPKNFVTAQFHPSYQSSKQKPHPLLVQFIELCKQGGLKV